MERLVRGKTLARGKTREHFRNLGSTVSPAFEAVEVGCAMQLSKLRNGGKLHDKDRKSAIKSYTAWFSEHGAEIHKYPLTKSPISTKLDHRVIYLEPPEGDGELESFCRISAAQLIARKNRLISFDCDVGIDAHAHLFTRYKERTNLFDKEELFLDLYDAIPLSALFKWLFLSYFSISGDPAPNVLLPSRRGFFLGHAFLRNCFHKDVCVTQIFERGAVSTTLDDSPVHPWCFENRVFPTIRLRTFVDNESASSKKRKIRHQIEEIICPIRLDLGQLFVDTFWSLKPHGSQKNNIQALMSAPIEGVMLQLRDLMESSSYRDAVGATRSEDLRQDELKNYGEIQNIDQLLTNIKKLPST
jgi:hypothetical protein